MTTLPGLLLMHGAGDAGACWDPFVERLRREPGMALLEVVAPDAPAHGGRLATPGHTLAWTDLVAEAIGHAESLAARTGGRIVAAGHSMGAMTALGVSAYRPDLVAATFLEDPPLMGALPPAGTEPEPPQAVDASEFADWFDDLRSRPLSEVVAATRAEHPTWDEAEYEPWARSKQSVDAGAYREPVVWVHADTDRIIRTAPQPVVVVAGQPDRGGLVAPVAEASLALLPGWRLHRLPASHDVRRDAPAQTAALLADLIRTVAR